MIDMEYRLYKEKSNKERKYLTRWVEDGRALLSFCSTFNVKEFRQGCMVEIKKDGVTSSVDLKTFMRIAKIEQL